MRGSTLGVAGIALSGSLLTAAFAVQAFARPGDVESLPALSYGAVTAGRVDELQRELRYALPLDAGSPVTLMAMSWEVDVVLSIESPAGDVLAQADDTAVATDASMTWQAPRAARYVVRAGAAGDRTGEIRVVLWHGVLDATPPDPPLAVRAHGEAALRRALARGDAIRVDEVRAHLVRLAREAGGAHHPDRVATRTTVHDELLAFLSGAESARLAGNEGEARRLVRAAADALASAPEDDTIASALAGEIGWCAARLQEHEVAQRTLERHERFLARIVPRFHPDLLDVRRHLGRLASRRGEPEATISYLERVVDALEDSVPPGHTDLLYALGELDTAYADAGETTKALSARRRRVECLALTMDPDAERVQRERVDLGLAFFDHGDLESARALLARAVEARERTLDADDYQLQLSRLNLGSVEFALGRLDRAKRLFTAVHDVFQRLEPEDSYALATARQTLGTVHWKLGELEAAHDLLSRALTTFDRTVPRDDTNALKTRLNLGIVVKDLGEAERAEELLLETVALSERSLPEEHPDLLRTRLNLAIARRETGRAEAARRSLEDVLALQRRVLPHDHPDIQYTRFNLALCHKDLGDVPAAVALLEAVHAMRESQLPEDHPDLALARLDHGVMLLDLGRSEAALPLLDRAHQSLATLMPENHHDRLTAAARLAEGRAAAGDWAAARSLMEDVVAGFEQSLPEGHPMLANARVTLAAALWRQDQPERAEELIEAALSDLLDTLPDDHGDVQRARMSLACVLASTERRDDLAAVVSDLVSAHRRRLDTAARMPPRQAAEQAHSMADDVSGLLSIDAAVRTTPSVSRALFELVEARRLTASWDDPHIPLAHDDGELQAAHAEVEAARRRVARLVSILVTSGGEATPKVERLDEAVRDRDRSERRVRELLEDLGAEPVRFDARRLAEALPPKSAAVGYLAYMRETPAAPQAGEASLLAHVLRPSGALERVELGPVSAVVEAAEGWRRTLGLARHARGVSLETEPSGVVMEGAGAALRRLVVDPVARAAGDATTWFVCLDDVLHAVPLDALPAGDGVTGDSIRIRVETSFRRLLSPPPHPAEATTLVALGDIDYDADGRERPSRPSDGLTRSPPRTTSRIFGRLGATRSEVEAIAAAYRSSGAGDARLLVGGDATKRALFESAPRARYLHLATHGYFSPDALDGPADRPASAAPWWRTARSTVEGLAPMTLCGLALAGANRGADRDGAVPGIATAEELTELDLRTCELVVLSACETGLGVARAGLGTASLQAAMSAAGARASVASLWRVDDEATQELMTAFYEALFADRLSQAEALWHAKRQLRDAGRPARDWAGWIHTGSS